MTPLSCVSCGEPVDPDIAHWDPDNPTDAVHPECCPCALDDRAEVEVAGPDTYGDAA